MLLTTRAGNSRSLSWPPPGPSPYLRSFVLFPRRNWGSYGLCIASTDGSEMRPGRR